MTGFIAHLLTLPVWLALAVVFAMPALESSVFLGFVFPGELALLLGGVVAGRGHAGIAEVLAAGIGGAIVGDTVGYLVGRRWGRQILASTLGRFVKAEHLDRARTALARRGAIAVLLGRFTLALRVVIPGLAGMADMPYRRFAVANVTGAALWGGAMVVAGYLAGNHWQQVAHLISTVGLGATLAVVAAAGGVLLLRRAGRLRRG